MSLARSRRTIQWAPCASGVVLLAAYACGGRVSGNMPSSSTAVSSGEPVGDVGSVGITAPSGLASGEGMPDATVASTDSSLSEAAGEFASDDASVAELNGACCGLSRSQLCCWPVFSFWSPGATNRRCHSCERPEPGRVRCCACRRSFLS
jgi:hypothetical protein